MWLFTTDGFYSVVANDKDKTLVVRTRTVEDAQMMRDWFAVKGRVLRIHSTPDRDYAYRLFVPRDWFADWLVAQGESITYGNFKDQIVEKDINRAHTYLSVWDTVRRGLQTHALRW